MGPMGSPWVGLSRPYTYLKTRQRRTTLERLPGVARRGACPARTTCCGLPARRLRAITACCARCAAACSSRLSCHVASRSRIGFALAASAHGGDRVSPAVDVFVYLLKRSN